MITEAFLFQPGDVVRYEAPHWRGYAYINNILDGDLGPRYDTDTCFADGTITSVSLRQMPPREDVEKYGRLHRVGRPRVKLPLL